MAAGQAARGGGAVHSFGSVIAGDGAFKSRFDAAPVCRPLIEDLDATFGDWASGSTEHPAHAVVTPPGDRLGLIELWAKSHDYEILEPADDFILPRGPAVVPRLERWFMRTADGLDRVRQLLRQVARHDRPLIIGCNVWAWRFLCKSIQIDLRLPKPMTFDAMGADRLQSWIASLVRIDAATPDQYRRSTTGATLMPTDDDPEASGDYFARLAAESLGVPWIAWSRLRASLRLQRDDHDVDRSPDDQQLSAGGGTVWVTDLPEFLLPGAYGQEAALILHAVLIHGSLTDEQLAAVVPIYHDLAIVECLIGGGMLGRVDDKVCIMPEAYPDIRRALRSDGFPEVG